MSNENFLSPNPELFKGEHPKELEGETYYAYLDTIELINGTTYLKLDCVVKSLADRIEINKESILNLPSLILETSGRNDLLAEKFSRLNLYSLESTWMVIITALENTEITQQQYYNFLQVGNPKKDYDLQTVILPNALDPFEVNKINQLVQATTLNESSVSEVTDFIDNLNFDQLSHVNVYNVGQGNLNALVDDFNQPILYFDMGGGSGANAKSYPFNFKICHTYSPVVILSHWDMDHIQTAVFDSQILRSVWLVPNHGSISLTAMHIAQYLDNNNMLVCWNSALAFYDFAGHRIVKCLGHINNKNNSGLALFVQYNSGELVLLPGDATFKLIPNYPASPITGLIASHHGAKASIGGMPKANNISMLAYSYGNPNTHGHAHTKARNAYSKEGWWNSLDACNGNIAIRNKKPNDLSCKNVGCSLEVKQFFK